MEILIGIGIALAVLFFWLSGHWFARVVMFLLLGAVLTAVITPSITFGVYAGQAPWQILFPIILVGFGLAWPIAGLPAYYYRRQVRQMLQPY